MIQAELLGEAVVQIIEEAGVAVQIDELHRVLGGSGGHRQRQHHRQVFLGLIDHAVGQGNCRPPPASRAKILVADTEVTGRLKAAHFDPPQTARYRHDKASPAATGVLS